MEENGHKPKVYQNTITLGGLLSVMGLLISIGGGIFVAGQLDGELQKTQTAMAQRIDRMANYVDEYTKNSQAQQQAILEKIDSLRGIMDGKVEQLRQDERADVKELSSRIDAKPK